MIAKCLPLLLAYASALLLVNAKVQRRCTEITWGNVSGDVIAEDPELIPPGERRHDVSLSGSVLGCKTQGMVLTVCDVLPPEVVVADDGASAKVLRLGPLWLPLLVEVAHYCDPLVSPTTEEPVRVS